jgi:hypothetical protein
MSINFNAGAISGGVSFQYPQFNGFRYSFSSVQFNFLGGIADQIVVAVLSLDYELKRERQQVHGTSVTPIGKTRGQVTFSAKAKMLKAEFQSMIDTLAVGDPTGNSSFGDQMFDVKVSYAEPIGAGFTSLVTDVIQGCTIDSVVHTLAFGPDAVAVEFDLNPLNILLHTNLGSGESMSSQLLQAPPTA